MQYFLVYLWNQYLSYIEVLLHNSKNRFHFSLFYCLCDTPTNFRVWSPSRTSPPKLSSHKDLEAISSVRSLSLIALEHSRLKLRVGNSFLQVTLWTTWQWQAYQLNFNMVASDWISFTTNLQREESSNSKTCRAYGTLYTTFHYWS